MDLTEGLYRKYALRRVFYSAYLPVVEDRRLPAFAHGPHPRGHQLYPGGLARADAITFRRRSC